MKTSHAGGRKTQNDAARPALGNALEQHVESLLASMTKEVEQSLARAAQEDHAPSRQSEVGTVARLASSCAALISATARLRGEFEHNFIIKHVHVGWPNEEVEDDDTPPLFAPGEIRNFTDEELLREIPIRKARYEAEKSAERLAKLERAGAPAPSASAQNVSAPAQAAEDEGPPAQVGASPSPIARSMAEIEAQIAALEEDAFSEENEDGLDKEEA
jgi:hypothetical protein